MFKSIPNSKRALWCYSICMFGFFSFELREIQSKILNDFRQETVVVEYNHTIDFQRRFGSEYLIQTSSEAVIGNFRANGPPALEPVISGFITTDQNSGSWAVVDM